MMTETPPVKAAARERAFRTLIQGAAIDAAVAVAAWVLANLDSVDLTTRAATIAVLVSITKTVLTSVASYVMRLKLAPSEETALSTA